MRVYRVLKRIGEQPTREKETFARVVLGPLERHGAERRGRGALHSGQNIAQRKRPGTPGKVLTCNYHQSTSGWARSVVTDVMSVPQSF